MLHLESDSDDEEDDLIKEIFHKNRVEIPTDVDFSDVTLAYKDSDNYDHDNDTDRNSDSDASAFKTRRQSMMSSTGTFQEDKEAGNQHVDPIDLHAMHDPVFREGHPVREKIILPSKYCLASHHSRLASLLFLGAAKQRIST